jgi:hypothetical protein
VAIFVKELAELVYKEHCTYLVKMIAKIFSFVDINAKRSADNHVNYV